MKKNKNILLITAIIAIISLAVILIFDISTIQTKTINEHSDAQKPQSSKSTDIRILHAYGLDTLKREEYVLKRKIELTLTRTENDSIISFEFFDAKDSLMNYPYFEYIKHDKSLFVIGEKHQIIESEKYINKNLSKLPFDLYETTEPSSDPNGPFLFNSDYGVLNLDVWSAGRQFFFLPKDSKIDIVKEFLYN